MITIFLSTLIFWITHNTVNITFDFNTCELITSRNDYSIIGVTFHYDKTRHNYDYLKKNKTINRLNLCSPNPLFLYTKECHTCTDSLWKNVPTRFLKTVDCFIIIEVGKLKKGRTITKVENRYILELDIYKEDWDNLKTKKAIPRSHLLCVPLL